MKIKLNKEVSDISEDELSKIFFSQFNKQTASLLFQTNELNALIIRATKTIKIGKTKMEKRKIEVKTTTQTGF
jgi:hypothetical protein